MSDEKPIWEGEYGGHRVALFVSRGMLHGGWRGHNPIIREGYHLRVLKDGQQIHVEHAAEIVATALYEIAAERDALRLQRDEARRLIPPLVPLTDERRDQLMADLADMSLPTERADEYWELYGKMMADRNEIVDHLRREYVAEREVLKAELAALSSAVFDTLNECRVQPSKAQSSIEAFKQLRKWIDMKRAERDDEERRRVAAQKETSELRVELETLKTAAVGLPIAEDIAELIHGDRGQVCEMSKTIARVYQHSIAPIIQYQHNTISALRAKLWPLEKAARDVVATHDVSWGSGAHSDAIDVLRNLIGDNNG